MKGEPSRRLSSLSKKWCRRKEENSLVQEDLADLFTFLHGVTEACYGVTIRHWALEEATVAADGKVDAILCCAVELYMIVSRETK